MDDSAETPEVSDQTPAGPSEAARKIGMKKRVADAMNAGKRFLKDERVAVAAIAVATAALEEVLARSPGLGRSIGDSDLLPDAVAENSAKLPEPSVTEGAKRRGPEQHQVKGSLVDLGDRQASPAAQENYRRNEGGDLPPGKTYRQPHSRGGPKPDDFDLSI
ncbi:hypothetical protein ACFVUB_10570 [Streptomyces niveus]|uniref:hypothetical protein n=1 Tax=Streptomyces niveus TaxID=193462 RepID=UPI0036DF83B9